MLTGTVLCDLTKQRQLLRQSYLWSEPLPQIKAERLSHGPDRHPLCAQADRFLEARFGVGHATLQVESGENPCGGCC